MAKKILLVNTNLSFGFDKSEKLGTIRIAPSQPAERLANSPDKTLDFAGVKSFKRFISKMLAAFFSFCQPKPKSQPFFPVLFVQKEHGEKRLFCQLPNLKISCTGFYFINT